MADVGTELRRPELFTRYVLVGLGGIGSLLFRLLVPFLHHERAHHPGGPAVVVAVDGDRFEEKNRSRMHFSRTGPKAEILCEELAEFYGDRLTLLPICEYLTAARARVLVGDGDVVFCQPDNHATRRILDERCAELSDIALFSGGNDGVEGGSTGTYGNVQIYLRRNGANVTNRISTFHPEIAKPEDTLPEEQGCAAAMSSAPQLLFTNAAVASAMLSSFYAWREGTLTWEETYLDIAMGRHNPVARAVQRL
jgi:molybdopterin/thiamine biosynthesis adenylyltransferase